ncbi:MAG: hypothetical protein B6I24_09945 [Bacteroidetes bacterium 4572_128]|nr:MAG: hypothetical protein B6I24_09945 [Bacteroidetes bacterium 4572_128]
MPNRLRPRNIFGERERKQESIIPKDIFVISIASEGKTEEQYFDSLSEKLNNKIIKIDRLIRDDERDTKSHPIHIIDLLDERVENWREHGAEANELWMVVDRDKQNVSKEQLERIFSKCKEKGYNIALSNPTFELWLLFHITDIANYNKEKLLNNEKVNKNRRFLDKELSNLNGGFKKNNLKFDDFYDGINDAIERAKELPTNNNELLNKLGTSVSILVEQIIK